MYLQKSITGLFGKLALLAAVFCLCKTELVYAQFNDGQLTGNFQSDVQYYLPDSANDNKEKVRMNAWTNLLYSTGNFRAGVRYEAYLPPLLGFEQLDRGAGIPHRFLTYQTDEIELTAGNFYDQFGSGLIFRTYEEKQLGIDNALDGVRVAYRPTKGLVLKGVYGRQRLNFGYGNAMVRGADAELFLNDLLPHLDSSQNRYSMGASVVSKYQRNTHPVLNLPEHVSAFAGRFGFTRGGFFADAEYAYKINDPSSTNNLIFKSGEAVLIRSGYSQPGFGFNVMLKRLDNMDFRSDHYATGNNLMLNFLPPLTRQYTYRLATIYPYATQANGEVGAQAEVVYTFKKGSPIGGQYGTSVAVNASIVNALDTVKLNNDFGYRADYFKFSGHSYYRDVNLEVTKKFTNKIKGIFTYIHIEYDRDQLIAPEGKGIIVSETVIADVLYKINSKHAIRTEVQHLYTKKDMGSWAMLQFEYSASPHWFVTVWDEYNYGNPEKARQKHYYTGGVTHVRGATRMGVYYGKQREGLVCIGGICRMVPEYDGFTLTISSTF